MLCGLNDKQGRNAFDDHGNAFYTEKCGRILIVDQHQDGKDDCRNSETDRDIKELCPIVTKFVCLHEQQNCAVNQRDGKHDVHGFRKLIGVYDELQSDRKTQQTGKQQQRVLIFMAEYELKREQSAEQKQDQTEDNADDPECGRREEQHDDSADSKKDPFKVMARKHAFQFVSHNAASVSYLLHYIG
jgi:hypothetical protein